MSFCSPMTSFPFPHLFASILDVPQSHLAGDGEFVPWIMRNAEN